VAGVPEALPAADLPEALDDARQDQHRDCRQCELGECRGAVANLTIGSSAADDDEEDHEATQPYRRSAEVSDISQETEGGPPARVAMSRVRERGEQCETAERDGGVHGGADTGSAPDEEREAEQQNEPGHGRLAEPGRDHGMQCGGVEELGCAAARVGGLERY